MSTHTVEVVNVEEVMVHPNADRLDIVRIKGWTCVTGKAQFQVGDRVIYIPVDSVLTPEIEAKLFPPESKIRLQNRRVRTIKIRGAVSQGIVAAPEALGINGELPGTNVAGQLGITKYEPKEDNSGVQGQLGKVRRKHQVNPHFFKYTDIENIKNYPAIFENGEPVIVTEKVHGTNFRAGWVKTAPTTLWKKMKKLVGLLPKYEFVYGSRNIQLQDKAFYSGYYDENVYGKIVKQYGLKERLGQGEVIYGEIYGAGIQKNYTYGCIPGEHKFAAFDIMVDNFWMPHSVLEQNCVLRGIPTVPVLYRGPFVYELMKQMAQGGSVLSTDQKVREGIVIRPWREQTLYMGRKVLKMINDTYLLDDTNTDFH